MIDHPLSGSLSQKFHQPTITIVVIKIVKWQVCFKPVKVSINYVLDSLSGYFCCSILRGIGIHFLDAVSDVNCVVLIDMFNRYFSLLFIWVEQ